MTVTKTQTFLSTTVKFPLWI